MGSPPSSNERGQRVCRLAVEWCPVEGPLVALARGTALPPTPCLRPVVSSWPGAVTRRPAVGQGMLECVGDRASPRTSMCAVKSLEALRGGCRVPSIGPLPYTGYGWPSAAPCPCPACTVAACGTVAGLLWLPVVPCSCAVLPLPAVAAGWCVAGGLCGGGWVAAGLLGFPVRSFPPSPPQSVFLPSLPPVTFFLIPDSPPLLPPFTVLPCFCDGCFACLSGRFYQLLCRGGCCCCISWCRAWRVFPPFPLSSLRRLLLQCVVLKTADDSI